jgi:OOP family OmpA-OmpF porin
MKLKVIASSIALFAITGSALAQGYVGFGVGQGSLSIPSVSTTVAGVPVALSGDKTTDTAYKLYGGYNYNQNWGVELGYNDLGSGYSMRGTAGGLPVSVTGMKVDNWYVAATGTLPVTTEFSVFGKLGWVDNHIDGGSVCVLGTCASVGSGNRSQVMYGVGVSYAFSKNWAARLEYEDFGKVTEDDSLGEIKATAWNLSVRYSF